MRNLGLCVAVLVVATASAQRAAPPSQEEIARIHQEAQDRLRGSTLVGPDDGLAIQLPNGELIPVGRQAGCSPPLTRAGLVLVDCSPSDGPAQYFDETTRVIVESCSFWFADPKRCPPKQWPVGLPDCDAEVPRSITGTWRLYATAGVNGFYPVDGGWTVTLNDESITFDFDGAGQVERSYAVMAQDNQRYSLEMRDDRSARTRVEVALAPCGLMIESERFCDAFCENFAEFDAPTDEQIRETARQLAGEQNDEAVQQLVATIREALEHDPQPIFPERAFFVPQ